MTGGKVVVLGPTGRNFAAGMSGGAAYVLDEAGDFAYHCNLETVVLERLEDDEEIEDVKEMIRRHAEYTQSERAWKVLALWEEIGCHFVKVMPKDYQRMLIAVKRAEAKGVQGDEAIMLAFEENKNDLARVSGN
jgi:glutamate synthase (ferredoxin)